MTSPLMRRVALAAGTAAIALAATPAGATNGYFAHGYSTQSKGMAGAGLTLAEGALGMIQNPALGVQIGNSAEGSLVLFMPFREATFEADSFAVTPGTYESSENAFLIMNAGVNYMLDDVTSLGLVMYGNGGMNTTYDDTLFQNLGSTGLTTGVDLAQAFLSLNLSRKVSDSVTLGIAPVFALQWFEAYGLSAFQAMSSDPTNVSDNGYDISFGGGLRMGVVYEPTPWLSLAATYQTKMWMSEFEQYSGLFAEDGDFDIPATAQAGIAVKPMKDLAVLLEWQRIFYSDVNAVGNTGLSFNALGTDNGMGFGWNDMDVFRIGVEYHAMPELTVRTGFSHATEFTDSAEVLFNTMAPATIQNHFSVGATYQFDPAWAVTFAYTYAFQEDLTGTSSLTGQTETISMDQHEVTLGVIYKF